MVTRESVNLYRLLRALSSAAIDDIVADLRMQEKWFQSSVEVDPDNADVRQGLKDCRDILGEIEAIEGMCKRGEIENG